MQLFRRIDFLGCFLLAGWVGAALIAVSLKTNSTATDSYKWSDPTIIGLFSASAVLLAIFLLVELKWAAEPVMPFELLNRRTAVSVAINNFSISMAQFALLRGIENLPITTLTIVALIADVGHEHVAIATSLSYVFRTIGQVLGVALSGALAQAILQKELSARITGPDADETIAAIRESSASIRYLSEPLKSIAIASYQKALHAVFLCAVILSVVYLLAGLGIREIDMHKAMVVKPPSDDAEEGQEEDIVGEVSETP
ncbi:uncharacterized protein I303_101185 [Kwoniella dejecticola CBS 10117]|uniref:Major facilitator superfamily (MFS) profile domain-containing protein n=1 Tax=Kwoniella dejecticola CBS 10117 TaxID=1296121 RepID=A0AAJ8MDT8_9TREE